MEGALRRTFTALVLGLQLAAAAPTQETTQACTDIKNALPGKVLTPGLLATEYFSETQSYWSLVPRSDNPACIVQPVDAADVSTVVKILIKYPSVKFTTRSGGHDPNANHASVNDGVLITMTDIVGATYDASKGLAYVKPGGEWNDVVKDLEPSGVTIAGGRLGSYIFCVQPVYFILTQLRNCRRWRPPLGRRTFLLVCSRRSSC
jgi:hypothetical protein